jgi:hypothetical protein
VITQHPVGILSQRFGTRHLSEISEKWWGLFSKYSPGSSTTLITSPVFAEPGSLRKKGEHASPVRGGRPTPHGDAKFRFGAPYSSSDRTACVKGRLAIDQLNTALREPRIEKSSFGKKFRPQLSPFLCRECLAERCGCISIRPKLGTSVQMIRQHYGKQATPRRDMT